METQIRFAVVAHHNRRTMAEQLAHSLDAHLFMDKGNNGANVNHRRALAWAATQICRVVILEDDAIPVTGFREKVGQWMACFPDSLMSFYLGTGRPPQYQSLIAEKLIAADRARADYITLPRLIHGVCYSLPPQHINKILTRWDASKPADYAAGDAWGREVIYPCYSLVDHADGEPVEQHPDNQPRRERRRAWRTEPDNRLFY